MSVFETRELLLKLGDFCVLAFLRLPQNLRVRLALLLQLLLLNG